MKYLQVQKQRRRTASRFKDRLVARRCWKNNAFTLIELLVVISILALLVSILLPSLFRAKELARRTLCASNIRNLATAIEFYVNESNDVLPSCEPRNREPISPLHWFMNESLVEHVSVLLSYDEQGDLLGPNGEASALTCPSHDDPTLARPVGSESPTPRTYGLSYGMNGTFGIGGRPDQADYRNRAEFPCSSDVLTLADCWGIPNGPGIVLYHACVKDNLVYRHLDTTNAAFLDSHVESLCSDDVPMGFANRFETFWSAKKP